MRYDTAPSSYGARALLGLRRRSAVRRHRRGLATRSRVPRRGLPLAAQVHRRAGHARRARGAIATLLTNNRVPDVLGGGTVTYVNPTRARLPRLSRPPRGGRTPDDRGSIRAGLVFGLKDAVTVEEIKSARALSAAMRVTAWDEHPCSRCSAVRRPTGCRSCRSSSRGSVTAYLHDNVRGRSSQRRVRHPARGGMFVRRPYGQIRLLGIDLDRAHEFEREIAGGCEGIKPGWVRVSLNYFIATRRWSTWSMRSLRSPTTPPGCCRTTASTPTVSSYVTSCSDSGGATTPSRQVHSPRSGSKR